MPVPGARYWGPLEDGHRNPGPGGDPPFFSFRTETQTAPPFRSSLRPRRLGGENSQGRNRRLRPSENRGPQPARFSPAGVEEPKNPPQSPHAGRVLIYHMLSSPLLPSANPRTRSSLLSVHRLYVHICIPINILFANHSLPRDANFRFFIHYSGVRPLRNWMILRRSLLLGRVAGNCSHSRIALRSAATFIRSSRLVSVSR